MIFKGHAHTDQTRPFSLSGDFEMDCSKTTEYKALEQSYDKLMACLEQSPDDVADKLIPSGKLAPRDLSFLSNQYHDKGEKAKRILDAMLHQVKNDPLVFHTFIAAMKAAGEWTKAAVDALESKYTSLQLATPQYNINHHPCESSSLRSNTSTAQAQNVPIRSFSVDSQQPGLHSGECLVC